MGDSQTKKFGDKYVGQLSDQLDQPAPFFNKSMFTGAGGGTRDAWRRGSAQATALDNSGGFGSGQRGAMDAFGGLDQGYADLSGAYDQDAPGYARMRQNLMDDAVKNVGAGFTQSGRFGGGSYIDTATEGALDAIAPLDYQNFQNGVNNKYRSLDSRAGVQSGLFGMGQQALDNETAALGRLGAIGSAQDANAQGARLGEADLYDRRNNGALDRLLKIGSGFGGSAVDAANEAPWWQQILGFGANALGNWWS